MRKINKMIKALIYTKQGCKYCIMAIELLEKHENISVQIICMNKEYYPELYARNLENIAKVTEQKTFPFIFIGDKFVGGFTELNLWLKN